MKEIEQFPNILWTPIRTKARKEKKVAEFCQAQGIDFYLPLKRSVKRYKRKTVTFYPPMFSGYLFCQINEDLLRKLLKCEGYFYRVNVDKVIENSLVKDLKNVAIFEEVCKNSEIQINPELVPGKEVAITDGPLKGITGIVKERNDSITVSVNIEILARSVTVKLDVGEVEVNT